MNYKTSLRKWHTLIGMALIIPMLILIVTGVILLYPQKPNQALMSAILCDSGELVVATAEKTILIAYMPVKEIALFNGD